MQTLKLILSDLKISIEHKYDYMTLLGKDYTADFDKPDIYAKTDDSLIAKENSATPTASVQACESICLYRNIAEQLPLFDRFVFHGAAIEYGGSAYIFTAPSGTGKTTHIRLWKKYLGDSVNFINGDKPIINLNSAPTVYGTPYAGKEGYQQNTSATIKAICVIKQSKTNSIRRIEKSQAINHLMHQVYMPQSPDALSRTLALIGKLIENVPIYLLECDISENAFKTSYQTLTEI